MSVVVFNALYSTKSAGDDIVRAFDFSPVPPLEHYIRLLLEALPEELFVKISTQTIIILERLHRVFPHARTVNPHGLYLAVMAYSAECIEACAVAELVRADMLFSSQLIGEMAREVARLLGGYFHPIDASEAVEMWHLLFLDDTEYLGGSVDAALSCGDWGGEMDVVPMWSRLLCDKKNFLEQLYIIECSTLET